MTASHLVALGTFPTDAEALLAQGVLDEAGIESMVRADNAGGMYPAIGGVELLVRAEDRDRAGEALARARSGEDMRTAWSPAREQ